MAALSNGADAEVLMKIGTDWHSKDVSYCDELNVPFPGGSGPLGRKYKGWRGGRK